MSKKYNPFKPNSIIHSGMFVGRGNELRTTDRCLFQTKRGNPQHFLILGERGIGKSSLLLSIASVGTGKISVDDESFNFLTLSIDLGGCVHSVDIIRKIARELRNELATDLISKDAAKQFYDWLTNWEVLGVKYNKRQESLDPEEISEQLVRNLSRFMGDKRGFDGILILIDEADNPPIEAALGQTLKMLTERLTKRDCNSVVFGLAGLPQLLNKLRDSHESSPRLFEIMNLKPLSNEERKLAVQRGISDANETNAVETKISDGALNLLALLSEGYPHFIQQFAFCAFENDTDNLINEVDVATGALEALKQLGDKFFNEMYHARISSNDYRRVLDAMSEHGDSWVERKVIIAESGVSESSVTNALRSLTSKEIILHDDRTRGLYKLPTNSFAAWIKANRTTEKNAN